METARRLSKVFKIIIELLTIFPLPVSVSAYQGGNKVWHLNDQCHTSKGERL